MENYRCLTCDQRIAYRRGCCGSCYRKHRAEIARGDTSWPELEEAGLSRPKQSRCDRDRVHSGMVGNNP